MPHHEPNRALARAKLETLAWEQTPEARRGRSGSRREVLLDTTDGTGMVPLGELTDFQLRRYIGPGRLEEAGDMAKNGHRKPKFHLGDRVVRIDDPSDTGKVSYIGSWQGEKYGGYQVKVDRDNGGPRHFQPENKLRLMRGGESYTKHSPNARRLQNSLGLHEDLELLQQLVESQAESMELPNYKDADVTPEVIRVAKEYDAALKWTLDEVVMRFPPKNGATADDLWNANAAYLVFMGMQGAGVGIWDGDWDDFYDKSTLEKVEGLLERKLGLYAGSGGGEGKLGDAISNAASETCGDPDYSPNARREEPDEVAARELSLYIENEYSLVGAPNSQGKAIEKNLLGHLRRGNFDIKKAELAYMYLMESGAKKYAKEFADGKDWHQIFNKPTRELVAHEFATTFAEEHGTGKSLAKNAHIEIAEFDAPAHWASAFINGDTSGLSDEEAAEFDEWLAKHPKLGWVVSASDESHYGRWNGLQTELLTYTAHVQ